jgi:hypothetical protein
MKKLALTVIAIFLLTFSIAQAALIPVNVIYDNVANVVQQIPNAVTAAFRASFFTATSTVATSTFPNASTTNLNVAGRFLANGSTGTNGQVLQTTGTNIQWVATSSLGISGGGGTPGGGNGQIQFNNAGSFGGTSSPSVTSVNSTSTVATSTLANIIVQKIQALTSAGLTFFSNSGTPVADFGSGGGSNASFFGGVNIDGQTRIATNLTGVLRADNGIISTTTVAGGGGTVYLASSSPWTTNQLVRVFSNGAVQSIATSSLGLIGTSSSITSTELAGMLTDETGTSGGFVRAGAPTFTGTTTVANISASNILTTTLTVTASSSLLGYVRCGTTVPPALEPAPQTLLDCWGADPDGAYSVVGNTNGGGNAYAAYLLNNNIVIPASGANYAGLLLYSSGYNNTAFGTFPDQPNALSMENTMGPLLFMSATTSNSYIAFATNGVDDANERMRITANGFIGIGTTTPSSLLTIAGNMRLTGLLADASSSTGSVGQLLMATATGTQWVSTSTLGIVGGGGASFATTTLIAGAGISFSGGTPVIIGSNPITIENTSGGGGGGSLSTTTEKVGYGPTSTVSYVQGDIMFGGAASTTAEFAMDVDGSQFIVSTSSNTASTTILSSNSAEAVVIGEGDYNSNGTWLTGEAISFDFRTIGDVIMRGLGSVTEWIVAIAETVFQGNVKVTGNLIVATTTYYGATTTDAIVGLGPINSGYWTEEFCTTAAGQTSQITADSATPACGRWAYLEDNAGVVDFVKPTTATTSYFRLRPGPTGAGVAAGDGIGLGFLGAVHTANSLFRDRPVMEWAWRQDALAAATSSFVVGGITNQVGVNADFAAEPTVGFYVYASSTPNWLFACNPQTGGTTFVNTGIATSTFASGANNPFVHFRIETTGTAANAVSAILKAATSTGAMREVANCGTQDMNATTNMAPAIGIGKSAANTGTSPELHVIWAKLWFNATPF